MRMTSIVVLLAVVVCRIPTVHEGFEEHFAIIRQIEDSMEPQQEISIKYIIHENKSSDRATAMNHPHFRKSVFSLDDLKAKKVKSLDRIVDKLEQLIMINSESVIPMWSVVTITGVSVGLLVVAIIKMRDRRVHTVKSAERDTKRHSKRKMNRKGLTLATKRVKYSSKVVRKSSVDSRSPLGSPVISTKRSIDPFDEVASVMSTRVALPERNVDKRIDVPMTEEEFMLAMKKVIEFITDQYRNPEQYPVSPNIRPNDIFNQLPQRAPDNPEKFDLVFNDFHEIILRGCIQWQHPRFHAFFPCGRSYPDILAETLISSLGTVGITWAANPAITELDNSMVNWLGRALGIPETFLFQGVDTCESEGGGWLADTASDAIFCAIMAARHMKVEEELAKRSAKDIDQMHPLNTHEKRAEIISKLVAYGSYECHSSFEKACKMALVRTQLIEVYEKDDWGMRRAELEKAMERDVQRGLIPFYIHTALGTTSTASSDHLSEVTPLRKKFGVWIHIDAAYAGSAWVVEKYRNNAGIEEVDSININLHKFFLTSSSVTPFWTRRQREYKEFFRIDPAYLKKKSGGNDLRNWGVQLTRRFKSLKVYMLLRVYGINGMRAYVERIIGMTEYMESLLVKLPNIRKFGKTNYGLFCVQYHEEGMSSEEVNVVTSRLCEFINNSHKLVFTHSNVRGHDIIRVAVTLERSTKKDVEESVAIFTHLVEEFKKEKKTIVSEVTEIIEEEPCKVDRQTSSCTVSSGFISDEELDIVYSDFEMSPMPKESDRSVFFTS